MNNCGGVRMRQANESGVRTIIILGYYSSFKEFLSFGNIHYKSRCLRGAAVESSLALA